MKQTAENEKLFKIFHQHKTKVRRPLNTGLYRTPTEIAQDNFRYFRTLLNINTVKLNIQQIFLAKFRQRTAKRMIDRNLRRLIRVNLALYEDRARIMRIAAEEEVKR